MAIDNIMESETIRYALMMLADDHVSNNNIPIMQDSTKSRNKILKVYQNKSINYKETHVPVGNETTWHTLDTYKDKVGTAVKTRKNKENLRKTSNCGAAVRQKTTKRSREIAQTTPSDGILYKKSKTGKYCKTSKLPPFDCIRSKNNNNMFDKNTPYYENIKQPELYQCNLNNSTNASQYLNHNNLKYADQQVMNSSPCFVASKNTQNFLLNNITNTQAQPVQSGLINDEQYYDATNFNRPKETRRNRNWKPSENQHSSINSIDTYKLLSVENKVPSSYNTYTSYTRNSTYTDIQRPPETSAASQQIANNITSNYIPSAVDSNNLDMTAYRHSRIERLYYKTFININYKHNSRCRILSLEKENGMPPPNNWRHMNYHVIAPHDLNLNILPDRSIVPDALPSRSLYTDSTNALSNTCNSNMVKENVVADRYREKDNFSQYTMPAFENSLPATNRYQMNYDELMNDLSYSTLPQNSTRLIDSINNKSCIMTDFANSLLETNTAYASEKLPSSMY